MSKIDLHPVDALPPTQNEEGRWKVAVMSFVVSEFDKARLDIGDTPVRSAQTMTIHAIRAAGLWDSVGVSARGGELYLVRKGI